MSGWQLAGFLVCVAIATCAQSITGFALALILLGLTSLLHLAPLPEVANVATVLSLASGLTALRSTKGSFDRRIWRATVSGSVIGVAAGVALMAWLQANVVMLLRLLLGVVVIACAVVVLVRTKPLPRLSSRWSFGAFGFLSGVLGGLFSASGPPLVYQYYRQPLTLDEVRDTLVATLAAGSLMRLGMVVPAGQFSVHSLLLCALSLPLAMGITWWMRRHPPAWPRATVLKVVCALLTVTGVGLIVPAAKALLG